MLNACWHTAAISHCVYHRLILLFSELEHAHASPDAEMTPVMQTSAEHQARTVKLEFSLTAAQAKAQQVLTAPTILGLLLVPQSTLLL